MPEMGVEGHGEVISIGNSPEIANGPGCVVTGRFRHVSDDVLSVRLSDQSAALGVTAQHPVYSLDRGDFVAAGELSAGDRCFSIINQPISSDGPTTHKTVRSAPLDGFCYHLVRYNTTIESRRLSSNCPASLEGI